MYRLVTFVAVTVASLTWSSAFGNTDRRYVTLELEQPTTLHVGELAVLLIPSKCSYGIYEAGNVLATVHVPGSIDQVMNRAVRLGRETIVLTPLDRAAGDGIRCQTRYYSIEVIPSRATLPPQLPRPQLPQ